MQKHVYLLCAIFLHSTLWCIPGLPITQEPIIFIIKNPNTPTRDVELILNILYWSYARSQATLTAINQFQKHFTICHQIGDCIHYTRRNPSRPLPYTLDKKTAITIATTCIHTYFDYLKTAQTYSQCTQYILKDCYDISRETKEAIEDIRLQARNNLLLSINPYIDTLKALQHSLSHLISPKNILSLLWSAIPAVAAKTFVKLDQQCTTLFHHLWINQDIHLETFGTIWKSIERARCNFYRELYKKAYNNAPKEIKKYILFDEHGFMGNSKNILPDPSLL
jgi:hypothetical protein